MRRACLSLLLLALLPTLSSCGPGPTIVSGPQPASFGQGGQAGAAGELPVVDVKWEAEPALPEEPLVIAARGKGAPMSLTSPDGAGLEITSMQVAAAVQDPLAFTEYHFVFKNPEPRTIEGRFEIVLPPGATISRFAMRNADGWKEGEVVEQQAARIAYEDFLHRKADPALLEKQAGNRFSARVFPIPASGEKEIIVSYSQALGSRTDPYRVFLRGLPRIKQFEMRVIEARRAESPRAHAFKGADFRPERDFVLQLGGKAVESPGLRHEELAVARVTPVAEDKPTPVRDLLVLLDTSASRALDLAAQVERLAGVLNALPEDRGADVAIAVACFDQGLEPVYVGPKKNFGRKELDAILSRKALGASDLGLALESAAAFAKKQGGRFTRALLVTDGIPTAGPDNPSDIAAPLARLREAGIHRLDAIAAGGIRDEALLRRLTTGSFAEDGVVLDAAESPSALAGKLGRATVSGLAVRVPGAKWVYPEKLNGIQPGDEALVYAELPKGAPFEVEIKGPSGAVRRTVKADVAERPLLERALAKAKIESLSQERDASTDEKRRAALASEILSISTKFRVLSDFTSLLVLETDEDYARFGIDRRALADILVVGRSGIELLRRTGGPVMVAAPDKTPSKGVLDEEPDGDGVAEAENKPDSEQGGAPVATAAPAAGPPPPPPQAAPLSRDEIAREAAKPISQPEERPLPGPAPTAAAPRPGAPSAAGASRPSTTKSAPRPSIEVANPWGDVSPSSRPPRRPPSVAREPFDEDDDSDETTVAPYTGKFAEVMRRLENKKPNDALSFASAWRDEDAGDALALIGLGEAYEALGDSGQAARAFGSIIDLFPGRADLRRFAGARLERVSKGTDAVLWLAVDSYKKAVASRPDHPSGHRMLAYAFARAGRYEEAFEAIVAAFVRRYPSGRFAGVRRVLADDVGILAAAFVRANPERKGDVQKKLSELGVPMANRPSLRFVLTWETDANDVDFHIRDGRRGHAFFSKPRLRSGGELFADVTTGYGPECFAIDGRAAAYPYRLRAHYYSKGPMGYGMGKLEIVEHDGAGGIKLEERPFVVMTDRAFVDLGVVQGPLKGP
jgi:tetratricopeptide (TPR) repeat protein